MLRDIRTEREILRGQVRSVIAVVMSQEVAALCGPAYHPSASTACRRGGTAVGSVTLDGRRERVRRPRVFRRSGSGAAREIHLVSYEAAGDAEHVRASILRALAAGVPSREQSDVHPGFPCSRSEVSRLWMTEGCNRLEVVRSRPLGRERSFALVVDGIALSEDLTGVVSLGITLDGRKVVLDFEIGGSENAETCDMLLDNLVRRGLRFEGPPLAILDGWQVLRKSVARHFPEVIVQRCLVHKERNIRGCLAKQWHGKLASRFNRLRNVEGVEAAEEAVAELRAFIRSRSRKAVVSLDEGGDDLPALHRIGCPSTLNVSLLSTNCIENSFKNLRGKIRRVKRWRAQTDQAERWLAYAL